MYAASVRRIYVLAACAGLALVGCGPGQTFSEVSGNLRVQGIVVQDIFSPQNRTLSLNLADAQTGHAIDARSVEVKAGSTRPIRATRSSTGAYTASFSDADRVEVLIMTSDRAAVIALERQ